MSDYSINPNSPNYDCGSDVRAIELTGSDGKPVNGWIRLGSEKSQVCVGDKQCTDVATQLIKDLPKAAKPTEAQIQTCQKFEKKEGSSVMPHLAVAGAGLALVGSHLVDKIGRHDLYDIPEFPEYGVPSHGVLEDGVGWAHLGLSVSFATGYTVGQQFEEPTVYWTANGICGAATVGYAIAAGVQKNGRGTPELNAAMNLGATCGSSLIYGHKENRLSLPRFIVGSVVQGGIGVAGVVLGALRVGARPDPLDPEKDASAYVDPSIAPGSRNIDDNPVGGAQFTNPAFLAVGVSQLTAVGASVFFRVVFPPDSPGRDDAPAQNQKKPEKASISPAPLAVPGGAGLGFVGTF